MSGQPSTGFLHEGVPYLRLGDGPPLVMVQGISPEHDVPRGFERRMALAYATPLARHFTVYAVNRKRGLRPGESMSDIAGHLSAAIEHDIGGPVLLQGTSTGGSVALQLAVDRPDLVRRLVVVASAYRLGPGGRELQAEMLRLTQAGYADDAWAGLMTAMLPAALRRPVRPLARVTLGSSVPDHPDDLVVTLAAEDVFDVGARLADITAPTLVIGGSRDVFYSRELFEATAAGVLDGRAHIFEGWGHLRTSASRATTNLTLGFMLAGIASGR
ncbi:MAG TPA: alpha/beta hydrolase [Candidatus Angelobacter sp.]|nr:alpha/beta hydrolase [Candidatus Angelobacter sp.]